MMLDSIALSLVAYEINKELIPSKIVTLHQVDQYGILMVLKSKKDYQNIFFSLRPDRMSFFISTMLPPEDLHSSAFLKQLQSQLQGGRLVKIEQVDFDRIIRLVIEPYQKFGTPTKYILIVEFMGKHSNAILVDENGYIKTALKQFGSELNRYREVKPGILYKHPPAQDKLNPLTVSKEQFLSIFQRSTFPSQIEYLGQFLYQNFQGLSTKSAIDITASFNLPPDFTLIPLTSEKIITLWEEFYNLREKIVKHDIKAQLLIDKESGKAVGCSLLSSGIFKETEYLSFDRVSTCLESFYHITVNEEKKQKLYQTIKKVLQKTREKLEEKKSFLEQREKEIENCEQYRKKGELIMANLWNIKRGIAQVSLVDYTLPNHPRVEIALNPDLSPLQNAHQLFQRYKKLNPGKERNREQLLENQKSLKQLKDMFSTLYESKNSLSELSALYQELTVPNYIKKKKVGNGKHLKGRVPSIQKLISSDGWTILVGRNNRQNEYLLRHLSNGNDFWLHNQTRPGAHVLIKNHQGLPAPPPDTLIFAARLTGYYSKVKNNETAQIVYTFRKYVKKPKDSIAGKVIYSQEKNIAVVINYEEIKKEINKLIVV